MTTSYAHRGEDLEALLDFAHEKYWNIWRVWIRHNGVRGRFLRGRKGTKFVPHPDKSAPDYYACVSGRFIAFDAKSTTNKTRWKLDKRYVHQYLRLLDLSNAGAVCFFAVEWKPESLLYLVRIHQDKPVDDWRPAITLPPAVGSWTLTIPITDGWYDWLRLLLCSWLPEVKLERPDL